MHLLKEYLESILKEYRIIDFHIEQEDIKNVAYNGFGDSAKNAEFILDNWEKYQSDIQWILNLAEQAGRKAIHILGKVPYFSKKNLIEALLEGHSLFEKDSVEAFFPVQIYVSANSEDRDTIGILVHSNGTKTLFEGNDEASEATLDLVDRILGSAGVQVIVYGLHTPDVVEQIKRTNEIPAGLYVSPHKNHAESHWQIGQDRVLFSGKIALNDVSQESEIDWRVRRNAKIDNFKVE